MTVDEEIRALREEVAKLRERVAVLEAERGKMPYTPLMPNWQPGWTPGDPLPWPQAPVVTRHTRTTGFINAACAQIQRQAADAMGRVHFGNPPDESMGSVREPA